MNHEMNARRLEQAVARAGSPRDSLIMVDGSSSVNHTQFEIMRMCTRQLVDLLMPERDSTSTMGVLQFSDDAKIECNLVNDVQRINCAITAMTQLRKGTNSLKAFQQAQFLFDTYSEYASRVIVFMTDGDCKDAIPAACNLRDKGNTTIIAIGIGMNDEISLAKMASNNSYFLFNSFEDLKSVCTHLNRTSVSPPKIVMIARGSHNATLQIEMPPGAETFLKWSVENFDATSNSWKQTGESQGTDLHLHGLMHNYKYKIRARAMLPNGTWTALSSELEFRTLLEDAMSPILRDPELREKKHTQMLEQFVKYKLRTSVVRKLNLLLVGRMGAGKSSLLDSAASVAYGRYTPLAPTMLSEETVTQTFKMYSFIKGTNNEPLVCLYDVYGWSDTNYKQGEFGYMLDGHIKSGYTEAANGFNKVQNPFYTVDPKLEDMMHAVIVVIPVAAVGSPAEMSRLSEFYTFLTRRGYQAVFALTKVDRLQEQDEVLVGHPENIYDSGLVDTTIDTFCAISKIPRKAVLPIINYTGSYEKPDHVVELLVLNVMNAAIQNAESFLLAREGEYQPPKEGEYQPPKEGVALPHLAQPHQFGPVPVPASQFTPTSQSIHLSPPGSPTVVHHLDFSNPPPSPDDILDLTTAAAVLQLTESETEQALVNGEIKGRKFAGKWRVTRRAILQAMAE